MDTDSLAIDNYIILNDNILLINSSLTPYKLRSSVSMNVECNYFSVSLDNIEGIKGALRWDHEFWVEAKRQPLKTRQNQLKEMALKNINCANSEEGSGKISIGTENNYGFQNSQTSSLSVSNRTIPSLYSKSKFQVKTDEKKMY